MPPVALPDGPELQRLLERAEIDQYADFFRALPQELAARMGLAFQQGPGWVRLTARGFDHPMFNRVLGLGLDAAEPDPREPLDTVLARSVDHYAAAGVRRWMLQVLPHVETASFRAAAANRGVVRLRGWAKHVGPARSDVPARTPLRVVRVGEPAAGGPPSAARLVEPWTRIVVENFGLPDAFTPWLRRLLDRDRWHLYLALDGERPVATGALHISPSRVGPLASSPSLPPGRRIADGAPSRP